MQGDHAKPVVHDQGHDEFRHPETVFAEAERLTRFDRQREYGHPLDDFTCTGRIWGAILDVPDIPAETVALMLGAGLKGSRASRDYTKRDTTVDHIGYVGLIPEILAERARRESAS